MKRNACATTAITTATAIATGTERATAASAADALLRQSTHDVFTKATLIVATMTLWHFRYHLLTLLAYM
jgi:hypothetical protein